MGSRFMKSPTVNVGGGNLTARAIGASTYAARNYGMAGSKDLGAAMGLTKGVLRPTTKDAAADAPGPKRV
jgi:hypothetical protein